MPKTFKEERRVLNNFLKWTIETHVNTENPIEKIPVPIIPKKPPRYFSDEELDVIFNNSTDTYRNIFRFLYYTGLRAGELANLQWIDFNGNQETLKIRIVAQDKEARTPGNKVKREEGVVPLSDKALDILKERKKDDTDSTYIFSNHANLRLDNDNIYRNLLRLLDKHNIANASPHTFRHTFASHLVIKGVSLYTVKELLRHSSIKDTEIYAHLSQEATKNATQLL